MVNRVEGNWGRALISPDKRACNYEYRVISRLVGEQELIIDPVQEWQCENRASIFPSYCRQEKKGRPIGS